MREVISASVLLLLALAALQQAGTLPLGTAASPGAGFFPLVLAVGLVIAAAILVVRAVVRPPAPVEDPATRADRARLLVVVLALFVYVVALQPLGFVVASVLLMFALFRAVQSHRWPVALGESVAAALLAHLVFKVWLGVRLPRGPWGF